MNDEESISNRAVAQVSKPAVSPISKSAASVSSYGLRVWKPAIRQTWKSALQNNAALAAAIATLVGAAAASGQETNVAPATDFSAFRVISQRNIFNQSRSGPVIRTAVRRNPVVEAFSLVGTMTYAKGSFAFFESNKSEFQKVLEPGETIAGHKLTAIYRNGVTLETGGKPIVMQVGSQMRREDRGAWYSSSGVELPSTSTRSGEESGGNDSSTPSVAPPPAASGEASDILRKLMQMREQELK